MEPLFEYDTHRVVHQGIQGAIDVGQEMNYWNNKYTLWFSYYNIFSVVFQYRRRSFCCNLPLTLWVNENSSMQSVCAEFFCFYYSDFAFCFLFEENVKPLKNFSQKGLNLSLWVFFAQKL